MHYFSSARGELLQDARDLWRTLPDSTPPNAPASDERASLFPTRQLFGGSRAPESNSLDLLLYPLVFAERALGYVVFDAPKQVERAWLLENIAGHLSGAVYALARADELREARALAERASADVFDALLSARPYQDPWTLEATLTEPQIAERSALRTRRDFSAPRQLAPVPGHSRTVRRRRHRPLNRLNSGGGLLELSQPVTTETRKSRRPQASNLPAPTAARRRRPRSSRPRSRSPGRAMLEGSRDRQRHFHQATPG